MSGVELVNSETTQSMQETTILQFHDGSTEAWALIHSKKALF